MKHLEIIQQLGQVGPGEAAATFDEFLRGSVRQSLINIMADEVSSLCGPAYDRGAKTECRRAGSAPSSLEVEGEKLARPRVRRRQADGNESEVLLDSYDAAKGMQKERIRDAIIRAYTNGVATGGVQETIDWGKGASASEVSRVWAAEGGRLLTELRSRRFEEQRWAALMLDGIWLSSELTAVVALGFTEEGDKVILDIEIGASENEAVCRRLVQRIIEKGFGPEEGHRLLAVLDGSKALKKAVLEGWEDAIIQRCLVHKERNIRGKLSRKHHGKLAEHFKALRIAQGKEQAEEALRKLRTFLKEVSAQGLESLEEAGEEELLAFHRLNVPNTLNLTFLSTNNIENAFRNTRRKIGRVTRWREETNQASKWLAYALLQAEKGFRRINSCKHMGQLTAALKRPLNQTTTGQ